MRRAVPALLLALAAAPAAADGILSPDAFETLAEGHTLYFGREGETFGAEQYFSGRRALWRFTDGTCQEGRWYAEGELICFSYNLEGETPKCWRFRTRGSGFEAVLTDDGRDTDFVLALERSDDSPLDCPGPAVGS